MIVRLCKYGKQPLSEVMVLESRTASRFYRELMELVKEENETHA